MERTTKTLVIDASVVAKWFVAEKDSDKAVHLRDGHIQGALTLVAPDIMVYEVANALRYHPNIADGKLREDIEDLFMLELELIQPSAELMALISQDSRLYAMSIYDASYVTLAGVLSANFVTADDALFEKCRKTGRVLRLQGLDQDWMT